MADDEIEKFFCNMCKRETKHFVRGKCEKPFSNDDQDFHQRSLVIECCGCENVAFARLSQNSDYYELEYNDEIGSDVMKWDCVIFPPITYRKIPDWYFDLPDTTLRTILQEIYKSLQTESHYLATFGSRTLIDRLIVLTVGDKGNFQKGMKALIDDGKLSIHEHEILKPVLEAGHAAAHRAWAPSKEMLATIMDTVENLIHRLLVLPKLTEELEEAVPARGQGKKGKLTKQVLKTKDKIKAAPKDLRAIYDALEIYLKSLGDDISINPQKHYIAFRRNRNFASVQIYNQKKLVRIYLNLDPDDVKIDGAFMRDVRQIGHFGTGDLEITIKSEKDIEKLIPLIKNSYNAS